MAGNTFSKKMCHELLLFEDYLLSCKVSRFHKDHILVERHKALSLIVELRGYHCADRSLEETKINDSDSAPLEILPKAPVEKNPLFHENSVKAEVHSDKTSVMEINEVVTQAAQVEAERIVEKAMERAKYIINEATVKADVILQQAEEKAQVKQQQVDDLLQNKIADAEKRSRELIERAHLNAVTELEGKNEQMHDMVLMGFQKADNLIAVVETIYAKQLDIIKSDRQEIVDILEKLQRNK